MFPIQIDPFSFIDKVPGVSVLDDTIDSTLFVYNDETYFYFTTTPTTSHTFSGSFTKNSSLVPITPDEDTGETLFKGGTRFTYDNSTDILYSLSAGTNEIDLNLYDNSFINPCGKLKLVDKITLEENIIDETVKIGKNLLGYRYNEVDSEEGIDTTFISIRNKYSNKLIKTITTIEDEDIIAFDIRDSDDSILVITEPGQAPPDIIEQSTSSEGIFYLYQLDAERIVDLGPELNPKIIYRHRPSYDFTSVNEDDIDIFFSQNDSNIFIINDRGFITTRFISNPAEVSGFADPNNLQYLSDMYFDNTSERFNLIEKKFNSNILRSNYFNYINYIVAKNDTDLFFLLHNIGRIYLFKESSLLYQNFVPLDLKNLYEKIISCESSLGSSLNSEIQNIVKDTVNIFLSLSLIPAPALIDNIPILRNYITYKGLDINFRDIEFHENEAVDYNVISRVINELFELQQQVLNSIVDKSVVLEEEPEDDFAGEIVIGEVDFSELNPASTGSSNTTPPPPPPQSPQNFRPSSGSTGY